MATIPSIALIPSGVKAGKIYSVLPTDGSGDFTFDRGNGTSTRINQQKLIESVSNDVPRLDYGGGDCPSLLLEPSRANLLPYSTLDFNGGASPNGWSIGFQSGTFSYEQLSYKGQKAVKQTQTTAGRSYLDSGTISLLANTIHTLKIQFILSETVLQPTDVVANIFKSSGNITYRLSDLNADGLLEAQFDSVASTSLTLRVGIGSSSSASGGTSVAWAIPQLEAGFYASSFIPTSGSTQTRQSETASKTGISSLINSSEGVLYVETKGFVDQNSTNGYIALEKGADTGFGNSLVIQHRTNGQLRIYANGFDNPNIHFLENIDFSQNHKIAVLYKLNGYKLFVDGVAKSLYGTPVQTVFSGLDSLSFNLRGSSSLRWEGAVKDARLFKTTLSDAELQTLTTI